MPQPLKRVLFLLFFASGFCGLLYQVVWLRLAFASFGIVTPVLSLVISVFMLGLALGSWGAGLLMSERRRGSMRHAMFLYAAAEAVIGIGAFAVPKIFVFGENLLLPVGEMDSTQYLLLSAVVIAMSILPFCTAMGTTFPLMMAFVRQRSSDPSNSFSFLYLANLAGALCGTLLTPLVLVELLGFRNTLLIGAVGNFAVAAIGLRIGISSRAQTADSETPADVEPLQPIEQAETRPANVRRMVPLILLTTGFISMSLEVIWTRAFTPVLQTQVYSFASLLFTYLLATWIGSKWYRSHLAVGRVVTTKMLLNMVAAAAFLQIVCADPRFHAADTDSILNKLLVLASIVPFCGLLGYLTPKLIDEYSLGRPRQAGRAYAINVVGSIVGPLCASYLLLPAVGVKWSTIILAIPTVLLALMWRSGDKTTNRNLTQIQAVVAAAVLMAIVYSTSYEAYSSKYGTSFTDGGATIRRDHTATVIAFGEGLEKRLIVNGKEITAITASTKIMAHMPLAFMSRKPESALVICFGMGATYRSLLTWDIDVTAVELIPSVRDSFGFYFDDAQQVLQNPRGNIVIDDGRRFLKRTTQTFDVVTLDPPPPVEAAGSSLLYSEEFYALVKQRLSADGILHQWFPGGDGKTFCAVVRSLTNSFPHVRAIRAQTDWGWHFLASNEPIDKPSVQQMIDRMPAAAREDLVEWSAEYPASVMVKRILDNEREHDPYKLWHGTDIAITDDRPYNEYFALRRLWALFSNSYTIVL